MARARPPRRSRRARTHGRLRCARPGPAARGARSSSSRRVHRGRGTGWLPAAARSCRRDREVRRPAPRRTRWSSRAITRGTASWRASTTRTWTPIAADCSRSVGAPAPDAGDDELGKPCPFRVAGLREQRSRELQVVPRRDAVRVAGHRRRDGAAPDRQHRPEARTLAEAPTVDGVGEGSADERVVERRAVGAEAE